MLPRSTFPAETSIKTPMRTAATGSAMGKSNIVRVLVQSHRFTLELELFRIRGLWGFVGGYLGRISVR